MYTREARKHLEGIKDRGELLVGMNGTMILLKLILSKYDETLRLYNAFET